MGTTLFWGPGVSRVYGNLNWLLSTFGADNVGSR